MLSQRAVVVGYGRMGGFHARTLMDFGYDVTTVDPDPARSADHRSIEDALAAAREFGDGLFDVAAIATPIPFLVESAFALAGTPMLVEKPFALDSRTGAMLAAYLEQHEKPVCVGYVDRFNPMLRKIDLCEAVQVTFTRLSDRPSTDELLDLRAHDIDLSMHGAHRADRQCKFVTAAGQSQKVRRIGAEYADGSTATVDLTAHDTSPLHAMWHAFLSGKPGYATPASAVRVLREIEAQREARVAA